MGTNRTVIKEQGNIQLVRTSQIMYGGRYAVIDTEKQKAKFWLSLDAATEIFIY